jgi:hypothetical protein
VEKLKILHKLQRAQQLTLRGGGAQAFDLINEVIVEILDERRLERGQPPYGYKNLDPYDNDEYSRSHEE